MGMVPIVVHFRQKLAEKVYHFDVLGNNGHGGDISMGSVIINLKTGRQCVSVISVLDSQSKMIADEAKNKAKMIDSMMN